MDDLSAERELRNYLRLRELTDEWIEITLELAKLAKAEEGA